MSLASAPKIQFPMYLWGFVCMSIWVLSVCGYVPLRGCAHGKVTQGPQSLHKSPLQLRNWPRGSCLPAWTTPCHQCPCQELDTSHNEMVEWRQRPGSAASGRKPEALRTNETPGRSTQARHVPGQFSGSRVHPNSDLGSLLAI